MALSKDFKITKTGFSGELIASKAHSKVSSISGDKTNASFAVQTFDAIDC